MQNQQMQQGDVTELDLGVLAGCAVLLCVFVFVWVWGWVPGGGREAVLNFKRWATQSGRAVAGILVSVAWCGGVN
jgi:hypothetical protein